MILALFGATFLVCVAILRESIREPRHGYTQRKEANEEAEYENENENEEEDEEEEEESFIT